MTHTIRWQYTQNYLTGVKNEQIRTQTAAEDHHSIECIQYVHTHTHPFNGSFSRTTQVSRYQKGKTNLDFTAARDSEWQWHQLGHMQVCTSLQTENHTSTPPLCFLQAGRSSCHPTNSVKALQAVYNMYSIINKCQLTWQWTACGYSRMVPAVAPQSPTNSNAMALPSYKLSAAFSG